MLFKIETRIIPQADTFDSLTSERQYRTGVAKRKVLEIINENQDTQFDHYLTNVFINLISRGLDIP